MSGPRLTARDLLADEHLHHYDPLREDLDPVWEAWFQEDVALLTGLIARGDPAEVQSALEGDQLHHYHSEGHIFPATHRALLLEDVITVAKAMLGEARAEAKLLRDRITALADDWSHDGLDLAEAADIRALLSPPTDGDQAGGGS